MVYFLDNVWLCIGVGLMIALFVNTTQRHKQHKQTSHLRLLFAALILIFGIAAPLGNSVRAHAQEERTDLRHSVQGRGYEPIDISTLHNTFIIRMKDGCRQKVVYARDGDNFTTRYVREGKEYPFTNAGQIPGCGA